MIIAVKERVIVHLIAIVYNETTDTWQAVAFERQGDPRGLLQGDAMPNPTQALQSLAAKVVP